jgi:hypothetical protein
VRPATVCSGPGSAERYPELLAAVMLSASLDWVAMHLAAAVRDVAAALLLEEEGGPIVRATELRLQR